LSVPIQKRRMHHVLKRAETILEVSKSLVVPVKWVYNVLQDELEQEDISLNSLTEAFRFHPKFRVVEDDAFDDYQDLSSIVPESEMESMGLFRGPRVMLRHRYPDQKEVAVQLLKKADATFENLKKAWDIRPSDDEAVEDQLLDALAKAQRLQRELRAIFMEKSEHAPAKD